MTSLQTISRRRLLVGAAALGAVALPKWRMFASTPVRGGTLRISVDRDVGVTGLNPFLARVNSEYLLAEALYSGLTRLGPGMSAEPDLAESWNASDDLTEWSFRLRRGVTFHDGSALTASDVAASFAAILDEATGSPARRNTGPIEKVSAPDDSSVVFRLSVPYADLPVALTNPPAKVVPAAVIESGLERLDTAAIGSGPFRLASIEPDRLVVLERNDSYYDKARPYLDRIEMVVYPDITAEGSALVAGDVDLMMAAQPAEFARFEGAPGVVPMRVETGQFLSVNMRCDEGPFADMRVRQALGMTVDREAMVARVAQGYGRPGNDTPIAPVHRYHADLPLKKRDIAGARALLAEAGYPDGLDLTLTVSDRRTRTELADAISEMAKEAGFNISVRKIPHAVFLEEVWKNGSFYISFYNFLPTEDAILSLLYTSDASWNETHWNNPDFDAAVADARSTIDETRRRKLYADAQKLMYRQVPSVIPVFFDHLSARRDYVEGYDLHPRGAVFRLDYAWLGDDAPQRR